MEFGVWICANVVLSEGSDSEMFACMAQFSLADS